MRRHIGAVGATLTAAGFIFAASGLAAGAAAPQTSQANSALRYLYSQVGTDGSVAPAFGPGAAEDTVISVADSGYDPATLKSPSTGTSTYSYLSSHASAINTAGGAAKYVLAWLAAGRPAAIDGGALLAKLNTPAPGGYLEPNGTFHNASATIETANAYSQALAVLADVGAGVALPLHATGWLSCAQRGDGGFGYAIHDSASTPPTVCGDSNGSDTNSTAIILQALAKAGVTSVNAAAEGYLHSAQHADGGFGFDPSSGSDPDSDGTVIQALVAIGQNPTGTSWTVSGGGNPLSNMETFTDPQGSGGYITPGNSAPDAFTTSAIPQALTLKPYASATMVVAGSSPPAAATATATPSPSPTGAVRAVAVPSTGRAGDLGAAPELALLLLALGSVALVCAALHGRRRPAP